MTFNHPDIEIFKRSFDRDLEIVSAFRPIDANQIKLMSFLSIDIYTKATRFLEASIKNIVYSCYVIKGSTNVELDACVARLKQLNNPLYSNIKELFVEMLGVDIDNGLRSGAFQGRDKTQLDEIVKSRHRNVHASHDAGTWYNTNTGDINIIINDLSGLYSVLLYLDKISFDANSNSFRLP